MAEPSTQECDADLVTFCVGGEHFQVLERVVRAKPDTLLCTLLDDFARQDKSKSIYVDADPIRFRYILDWYRYGSIRIPGNMGIAEIRRELAFYQLPDGVKITRDSPGMQISDLQESIKRMQRTLRDSNRSLRQQMLASEIFRKLIANLGTVLKGGSKCYLANQYSNAAANCPYVCTQLTFDASNELGPVTKAVQTLAGEYGFQVTSEMAGDGPDGAWFTLKAVRIPCSTTLTVKVEA
mmetsp:Transcript_9217/g.21316  ORF Transcript_9217/g.21316 Transcript_9217/m.21316 type:complete len:238 (-) Transcript_9217:46-759(-)